VSIIKKRRLTAYRFLKTVKMVHQGRGKTIVFDIAQIPKDMDINDFLKSFRSNSQILK
jgi:hypothetical protein